MGVHCKNRTIHALRCFFASKFGTFGAISDMVQPIVLMIFSILQLLTFPTKRCTNHLLTNAEDSKWPCWIQLEDFTKGVHQDICSLSIPPCFCVQLIVWWWKLKWLWLLFVRNMIKKWFMETIVREKFFDFYFLNGEKKNTENKISAVRQ